MESFHHHQIFYRASFENALRDDVLGVEFKTQTHSPGRLHNKKAHNLAFFNHTINKAKLPSLCEYCISSTKQNCLHDVQSMNLCFNTAAF